MRISRSRDSWEMEGNITVMCGRFYVDDETLKDIERIIHEVDANLRKRKFDTDVHPSEVASVIHANKEDLFLTEQVWGFPGIQQKGLIINARAETVLEKKIFRDNVTENRIVIPARKFYEWNKNKEKNTFSREDSKVLFFAGFFGVFEGEKRFVILTCEANDSMIQIHNRMPLILEANQIRDWLTNTERAMQLLHQIPILLKRESQYEQQSLFQ